MSRGIAARPRSSGRTRGTCAPSWPSPSARTTPSSNRRRHIHSRHRLQALERGAHLLFDVPALDGAEGAVELLLRRGLLTRDLHPELVRGAELGGGGAQEGAVREG